MFSGRKKALDTYETFRIGFLLRTLSYTEMTPKIKPTSSELEILSILWENKSSTVRDVHAQLNKRKPTKYTTVLKLLQIMHEKGLVKRDEKAKAHIYRPVFTRERAQKALVSDLLERAFRGSALKLVQHVLESKPATREELAEIRRIIAEVESKGEAK
jgi:BlaI family transcriptional regulator, penicillinase repressor